MENPTTGIETATQYRREWIDPKVIHRLRTRVRVKGLNERVVRQYKEQTNKGASFPLPVVFQDGDSYFLADGEHRLEAHTLAGAISIECEVHRGTEKDALVHSLGANCIHGFKLSSKDKWNAVTIALRDPEISQNSNVVIAEVTRTSESFVRKVAKEIGFESSHRAKLSKNGHVIDVSKIGKHKQASTNPPVESNKAEPEEATKTEESNSFTPSQKTAPKYKSEKAKAKSSKAKLPIEKAYRDRADIQDGCVSVKVSPQLDESSFLIVVIEGDHETLAACEEKLEKAISKVSQRMNSKSVTELNLDNPTVH